MRFAITLGLPLALCLGCSRTYTVPASHVSAPVASLRAAEQAGAESDPEAALHAHLAQRELAAAGVLMRSGHAHEADLMLIAARADAGRSLALARRQHPIGQAQSAIGQLRSLAGPAPAKGVTAPQPAPSTQATPPSPPAAPGPPR